METRYSFSGSENMGFAGSFTLPLKWKPEIVRENTHLAFKQREI